jgi:hypothetical protein
MEGIARHAIRFFPCFCSSGESPMTDLRPCFRIHTSSNEKVLSENNMPIDNTGRIPVVITPPLKRKKISQLLSLRGRYERFRMDAIQAVSRMDCTGLRVDDLFWPGGARADGR